MDLEENFIDLYRVFLTEVNIISTVSNQGFFGQLNRKSEARNFIASSAIRIKLGDEDIDNLPDPFKKTVANLSSKIEVRKNDDNDLLVSSKEPFAQRIIAEFNTKVEQEQRKAEYVGIFKVTNFTNLVESTLTSLCSWSLKNFKPNNKKFEEQTMKVEDFTKFNSIEELRNFALTKYINGLTYKAASEWIKDIADIIDPKIKQKGDFKSTLDYLTELYLRRNIFVHNSGKVNYIYLSSLPDSIKGDSRYQYEVNDNITADDAYINFSFSKGILILNVFFLNRVALIAKTIQRDKERLEKFFIDLNNTGVELYNQNYLNEGTLFFKTIADISKLYLGEGDSTTFLYYYNYYLGIVLNNGLSSANKRSVKKLFEYSKKQTWWLGFGEHYTTLSEASLTQSSTEFCDTVIQMAEKFKNSSDRDKEYLANIMQWPMLKIVENDTKWIKFVDNLYDLT